MSPFSFSITRIRYGVMLSPWMWNISSWVGHDFFICMSRFMVAQTYVPLSLKKIQLNPLPPRPTIKSKKEGMKENGLKALESLKGKLTKSMSCLFWSLKRFPWTLRKSLKRKVLCLRSSKISSLKISQSAYHHCAKSNTP